VKGPERSSGLRLAEAGLKGSDAPRHASAEGISPRRHGRRDRIEAKPCQAAKQRGSRVRDRHGSADETQQAARPKHSGGRARPSRRRGTPCAWSF
jgi:hypothetical protein